MLRLSITTTLAAALTLLAGLGGASLAADDRAARPVDPQMPRATIAGGAGASTGGAIQLRGTIGQAVVGPAASAGAYAHTAGFWAPSLVAQPCLGADALFCGSFERGDLDDWSAVVGPLTRAQGEG
ncbi:MAG: hypothetical protein AAF772_13220 [Acidobacteriota bacterium]